MRPHGSSPALFFQEQVELGGPRLYRLDVASSAVSEVPISRQSRALAASPDASRLIVASERGVGLWDVSASRYLWTTPAHKDASYAVFTRGEAPSAPDEAAAYDDEAEEPEVAPSRKAARRHLGF